MGEPGDPIALDDAVTDQPHGPTDGIGSYVPLRRSGRGIRQAAFAGAVAGGMSGCRGRVEGDVAPLRRDGRTRWAAVDAGGAHGDEEDAVEARVPTGHRSIAALGIAMDRLSARRCEGAGHGSILTLPVDAI
jgi:hypothetical protein